MDPEHAPPLPISPYPDEEWLTRLRRGNLVYLAKDRQYAQVEWAYEPPNPNSTCGRIGLQFRDGRRDTWFIRANGRGINETQCLLPVTGHVPVESPPLPPGDIRHILRRLDRLEERVFPHRQMRETIVDMPTEHPTSGGGILSAPRGYHPLGLKFDTSDPDD